MASRCLKYWHLLSNKLQKAQFESCFLLTNCMHMVKCKQSIFYIPLFTFISFGNLLWGGVQKKIYVYNSKQHSGTWPAKELNWQLPQKTNWLDWVTHNQCTARILYQATWLTNIMSSTIQKVLKSSELGFKRVLIRV